MLEYLLYSVVTHTFCLFIGAYIGVGLGYSSKKMSESSRNRKKYGKKSRNRKKIQTQADIIDCIYE